MVKVGKEHLLTAEQMAQFVVDGFLFYDAFVPKEYNKRAFTEMQQYKESGYDFWNQSSTIREIFDLPAVKGVVESLVGENPRYDHSYLHYVDAGSQKGRGHEWHYDSTYDARPLAFDIQVFYFPHDAPAEMGPTMVLPGSHLRRVSSRTIARYQNIAGQRQLTGNAGMIAFVHHGIWHCSQPNFTDQTRFMFKVRYSPTQTQRNCFNTEGYANAEISRIFEKGIQPWLGDEHKQEQVKRAKLWRYVTGNDSVDVTPEKVLLRVSQN